MAGSSKHYGHDLGFSCAFRQWQTDSHCNFLHGYALAFTVWFNGDLDERNWVMDFGGLKTFKAWLTEMFDHKTVVAEDDPHLAWFLEGRRLGTLDLVVVPAVGCERFAQMVYQWVHQWLNETKLAPRVSVKRVRVAEHGANAAYWPDCP